ncbi:MAG: PqqD family protein [Erysipelotrichaceae bacterium]|nr:PqqD family protein [Erysipelotrichaceae bacterium]
MKLKSEYVTYPVDDKEIMVGTGTSSFKGIVKMNASAAFIISCLKEETDEENILDQMMKKYDADQETMKKDIARVLETLRNIGALDE